MSSSSVPSPPAAAPSRVLSSSSFPAKLLLLLQSVEDEHLSHIVSWQPHGRSFMVHNPKEFQKKILPRFFRQTKYSSFQRQLNIYEFQRISAGPDKNAYYHLSFQRGRPDLISHIQRVTIKGTGIRRAPTPEDEPNFYQQMPPSDDDAIEAASVARGPRPIVPARQTAETRPLTLPTHLTSLDLLSQLQLGGGGVSSFLAHRYSPPSMTSLDFALHRAQQMLEESRMRETWAQLSALEELRNRRVQASSASVLRRPTSESLLQQFLAKHGTRHVS